MPLRLFNSLTERLEPFNPYREGEVTLYVCGPTVYSDSHLGHAKTYVSFDVILRYLRFAGFHTFYVQNITDVGHLTGDTDEGEDKLLRRARELAQEPMAVAETYTRRHFALMDRLDVIRPDISPRATGHIPEQLEAIAAMVASGHAYEAGGSVYFDVTKDAEYGQLSNRTLEELQEGTRVGVREEKRNPQDFALWKHAEPEHLMRWRDSYSGWGYPGWHTECAVMSTRYLGDDFDIHGGGMDLKFPHHECEIAQARALGRAFARYWLHSNMLTIEGQKMSKSAGNFVTVEDALAQHDPLVIRYFIVASHYRSVLDYSESALSGAKAALQRLHQTVRGLRAKMPAGTEAPGRHFQEFRSRFCAAMDDDFGTPQALAVLFDLSREANTLLAQPNPEPEALLDAEQLFRTLGGDVLGLTPEQLAEQSGNRQMDDAMQILIKLREQFREAKDYQRSDWVREQLQNAGIVLKDSRDGTTWEVSA